MKVVSAVLVVLVMLFVSVSSAVNTTARTSYSSPASGEVSTGSNSSANHPDFFSQVFENFKASKLYEILPDPIHTFFNLVNEIRNDTAILGDGLPSLLRDPIKLVTTFVSYFISLVLIIVSFIPPFRVPVKFIAFLFSILGILSNNKAPFNTEYLSNL
jgi:hypothetical protein